MDGFVITFVLALIAYFLFLQTALSDKKKELKEKEYALKKIKEAMLLNEKELNEKSKQLKLLFSLYPALENVFIFKDVETGEPLINDLKGHLRNLFETVSLIENSNTFNEIYGLKNRISFLEASHSNLTAIPYMAQIMADYETYGIEALASSLDWGCNVERKKKVKSLREIRKEAQYIVEKNKESQYQLAYLLNLFPGLEDVIETEFKQLPIIQISDLTEHDSVKDYLTKEEYNSLTSTERNQLALDRYKSSHNKTKWQIGRDYEFYVGYTYQQQGYSVEYFGSEMGLEDLGRDVIATKNDKVKIIQCKYWSSQKQIHEKHINQLYGTMVCYCIENNISRENVSGILITNITLSETAKKMAQFLNIEYIENFEKKDYPCIKCNIGHDEYGFETKIYHLPFDQQYDTTKISKKGEFYALTVKEAEDAGFRRAFKWLRNE